MTSDASDATDATKTSLGHLVRTKREKLHLSMEELSHRSGVSRSTLHRVEHDDDIRPTAPKLTQILTELKIEPEELRAFVEDEKYLADIEHWMERSAAFAAASGTLDARSADLQKLASEAKPDLVAIKGEGVARIRHHGSGLEEITDALQAAGWDVMRPV